MYNFPNAPTPGLAFGNYTWDGEKWVGAGAPASTFGMPVFNVKDYGAIGDSTNYANGTDDRGAIQAAANAAMAVDYGYARGGMVVFPPGLYRISGPIICQKGGGITFAGTEPSASGIGGSFPDYLLNDELNPAGGISIAGVRNLNFSNRYKNLLTSLSYAPGAGNATASAASITGTVLTVGGTITGTFGIGQIITTGAAGQVIATSSIIISLGTGTGGVGTYNLSKSSTMSGAVTATDGGFVTIGLMNAVDGVDTYTITVGTQLHIFGTYPRPYNGRYYVYSASGTTVVCLGNVQPLAIGTGTISNIGNTGPGTRLNVPAGASFGTLLPGQYISGAGVAAGTKIVSSQGDGHNYDVDISQRVNPAVVITSNPGPVTMLGAVGGGGIRMDNTNNNYISKCLVQAFNAMHLGGAFGYGSIGQGSYNAFGLTVRDTSFSNGMENGEYGTVGAYCGEVWFYDCNAFQWDKALVASSNGFGFYHGGTEVNNTGFVIGQDDQLAPAPCGACAIVGNHSEDCDIAVDLVGANNFLMASCQWTGIVAARGPHTGVNFNGTTSSGTPNLTNIAATVLTGNTTIASPRITNLSSVTGLYQGMAITGPGIPAGSAILTIDVASNRLTFINTAGVNGDPIGASATASGVTLTFTVAAGMWVTGMPLTANVVPNTCVQSVNTPSGGIYSVVLNKNTIGSGTNSYQFQPTPAYGIRVGTVQSATFLNNSCGVAASIACTGLKYSNAIQTTFVGHLSSNSAGLGAGWEVPSPSFSPSAAGITYINSDNPSMAFPYSALPGQPGQTLSTPIDGMVYDITDCNTATFLATAAPGGTGAAARRKVRYSAALPGWQVIG